MSIVFNVIQCLSDMISNLMMQKIDEEHISKTKLLIKQFLSAHQKMDKALQIHSNATTKKELLIIINLQIRKHMGGYSSFKLTYYDGEI
jgi:hypothetical protein